MKKTQLILAGFVACSLSLFAETMTVSITPSADAWCAKGDNTNRGSDNKLEVRTNIREGDTPKDEDLVGLLSFAMPQIPENARITSAHLFLTTERIKGDKDINIFPLNQDFDESTVVYADVADAIATARTNGKIASFAAKGQSNKACDIDVIDANYQTIDAWCNDINITHYVKAFIGTNLTIFLSSNKTEQANPSCYFTKEATGHVKGDDNKGLTYTAEQVWPKLVITYTTDPYAQMAGPQSLKVTFNGTDNDGWAANVTSSSVENGILSATQDKSGENYRGDLKFNKSGDKTFKLNPEVDKYLAIKFVGQRPAGKLKMEFQNVDDTWCNNKWNGGDPTKKSGKNSNGTVYYFDLTSDDKYMSGHLDADGNFVVKHLNFIIADNPNAEANTYQVDWIATFASVEDIQAWVDWNDQIAYDTQYPVYEFDYRPKSGNTTWDSETPKSGWSNGTFEMRYGSRLFVIQAYRIKDYQATAIYTLKLNHTSGSTGELGVWNFPYADIPVVGSQSNATLCNYAKEVTGIGMDMQGTKKDPIATITCVNNVWTFTIPGYCLTPISVDAEGYTWVSVLITTPDLTNDTVTNAHLTTCMSSNSTDKFSTLEKTGTFSAAIGSTLYATIQDALSAATNGDVITVFANQEISARINTDDRALTIQGYTGKEVLSRKASYDGIMFLTTDNTNAALTVKNLIVDGNNVNNTSPVFEASNHKTTTIENVTFRNVTSSNGLGSVICNKVGGVLVMKDIQFENCICTSDTPSLVFFGTSYATIKGNFQTTNCGNVPMIRVEKTYNFAAADLTNTEPITILLDQYISGNKIVSGYTDASKFLLYNAPLFVLKNTGTDLNLQSLNVRNETTGEVYTTLADAVTAAETNDVLTVCQNTTISGSRLEIKKALTIQGATGQEKIICGVAANTLMVLANDNTADYTVTFKNLIVDGQNTVRSTQTFDTDKKAKMCFDGVSVINTTYSVVTGDVKGSGNNIILKGNNSFPTGIYLNKKKRVENNNTTHTEPIPLILAGDYEEDYAIVLTCTNPDLFTVSDQNGNDWHLYISNKELKGKKYKSAITLDESLLTNEDTLAPYNGRTVNITLARTIAGSATDYSTLCLPFETTQDELGAAEVYEFINATFEGQDLATLHFEPTTDLEAGKPYLVRFAEDKENPTFEGKTITAATPGKYGDENYEFIGLFSKTQITETEDKTMMYLGSENTLYWAAANCTIKGSRGYFKAVSAPAQAARRVAIGGHGAPTPLVQTPDNKHYTQKALRNGQLVIIRGEKYYNAQGQIIK